MARAAGKIVFASLLAAAAGYLCAHFVTAWLGDRSVLQRALVVGAGLVGGGAIYVIACVALQVEEMAPALGATLRIIGLGRQRKA